MLIWHSNPASRALHISSGGNPASGKMNQEALDRALRPSWRWGNYERLWEWKIKPPVPSPSLLPEAWLAGLHLIHIMSTKRFQGKKKNEKTCTRNLPSEWLQTSQQHWRQVGHFEEKGYPNWISVQQPNFAQGKSRIKTLQSHRAPGAQPEDALEEVKCPPKPGNQPGKRKMSVWERRQEGPSQVRSSPRRARRGQAWRAPVQRSKREI